MRPASHLLPIIVCAVFFFCANPPVLQAVDEAIELGDAFASVNGVLIEPAAFNPVFARVAAFSNAADQKTLALDLLNSLVEAELIRQYAAENEIEIAEEQLEAEIDQLKATLRDSTWVAWLEENLYSEAEFRETIRLQLLTEAVHQQLTAHLADELEHVRARHILLSQESGARQVLERLRSGEDFAALAAELSRDVSTRDYGGDLGWFVPGELLEQNLSDAAFSQPIGKISAPIATRLGYHILQVIDIAPRHVEARRLPHLRESIFQRWLQEQVERAEILLNLEALGALRGTSP